METVFLDIETTGLHPEADQIIEYSFVTWKPHTGNEGRLGDVGPSLTKSVMPTVPCNPQAAAVNGFSVEEWTRRGAQPFGPEDVEKMQPYLYAPFVAGWNLVEFDLRFLERVCPVPLVMQHRRRVIDVMSMAAPLLVLGEVPNLKLVTIAAYFRVATEDQHTAVGDAYMTIKVWEKLLEIFGTGLLA